MRKFIDGVLGFGLVVVFSAGSLGLAHAASEKIPPDVQAAYSAAAITDLQNVEDSLVTTDKTGVPDFSSASSFGTPHQVHLWSAELIAGKTSSDPTAPLEEWLASIDGPSGELLGTYRVWRPAAGNTAELAGYSDDIELAGALSKLDDKSDLVSDPAIEGWYAVSDGSVTALNQSAAREVPYTASIEEVAGIVAARYAAAIQNSEEVGEGAAGGMAVEDRRPWYYGMDPWVLGVGVLLLLAAAGAAVWRVTVRRRAH